MLPKHSGVPRWSVVAAGLVAVWIVGGTFQAGHYFRLMAAAPVSDVVEVKFDEWMTPSARPFPHDPAAARDGSVWYTAQLSNAVGRLDPTTGQFREFSLPTPDS